MQGTSLINTFQHDLMPEMSCFLIKSFSLGNTPLISLLEWREMKMLHGSSRKRTSYPFKPYFKIPGNSIKNTTKENQQRSHKTCVGSMQNKQFISDTSPKKKNKKAHIPKCRDRLIGKNWWFTASKNQTNTYSVKQSKVQIVARNLAFPKLQTLNLQFKSEYSW